MAAAMNKRIHLRQGHPDDLPPEIIQRIQSFLPEEDAACSSLVSKLWLHARSTRPSLRFHQPRFGLPMVYQSRKHQDSFKTKKLRQRFLNLVEDTVTRYSHSNLLIEDFDLSVEIAASKMAVSVKRCLQLVSGMGLKHLSFSALTNDYMFTLPLEIFSSEALRTLKIEVDGLGEQLRCPRNPSIRCFSLQVLKLQMVHISDELINELIISCPLLEEIILHLCDGFDKIQVRDLHRLRVFDISSLSNEIVEVDAPSLRSFKYGGDDSDDSDDRDERPCRFNIDASRNLTRLELHGVRMKTGFFKEFISKFPLLEQLIIRSNYALKHMDIACPSLTELSISDCLFLEDVKVQAPRLVRFDYSGSPLPTFKFPGVDAEQFKVYLNLECGEFLDYSCFLWLSKALHVSQNISLGVNIGDASVMEIDLADLREENDMLPFQNVKELLLSARSHSTYDDMISTIMDALFTVCHPRYIVAWHGDEEFCDLLLTELMDRRMLSSCSLDNLEVTLMNSVDDEDEAALLTVPWKNLILESAKDTEYQYIRFGPLNHQSCISNL